MEHAVGRRFVIDVSGQVSGVQQINPCPLILQQSVRIGLLHHSLRAIDITIALIQQILADGLPCQLRAELESLNDTVPDRIQLYNCDLLPGTVAVSKLDTYGIISVCTDSILGLRICFKAFLRYIRLIIRRFPQVDPASLCGRREHRHPA